MWCYRKMMKIIWSDNVSNEEDPKRVNRKCELKNAITKRRTKWFGHIIRHQGLLNN